MTKTINNQFNAKLYDLEAVKKLESMGFIDDSWGNDSCPKFYYSGEGYVVQIWIETTDPDMREFQGEGQFTAVLICSAYSRWNGVRHEPVSADSLEDLFKNLQSAHPKFPIPSPDPC